MASERHAPKGGDGDTSVRVAVRVRPQTEKEINAREKESITCSVKTRQASIGQHSFTFDYLYDQNCTQQEIYEQSVDAAMAGYNATIFAYGQTGSGKTYTMGSAAWNAVEAEHVGMLPRALHHLFQERAKRASRTSQMEVRASFLEIHNEELKDLLAPPPPAFGLARKQPPVSIREDSTGGIYFAGAEEREVNSIEDMLVLLEQGTQRRATGATEMNAHSSRSHAIFSLLIEQRNIRLPEGQDNGEPAPVEEEYITSKFHFVDLAGSERVKKTKAEGDRLKEGISINGGLLALGNVISALGDETRGRHAHVPYRDSKLTRMLQDSLGGNSRTLMIACISPADSNSEESVSTLKYANRARNIKNTPVINRDPNSHLVAQLRKEIAYLRDLLSNHGIIPHAPAGECSSPEATVPIYAVGLGGHLPASPGDERRRGEREMTELKPSYGLMEEEVRRLREEAGESRKALEEFKLGMAQVYTCSAKLLHQLSALRSLVLAGPHGEEEERAPDGEWEGCVVKGFSAVEKLVRTMQDTEDRCRFKHVAPGVPSARSSLDSTPAPANPALSPRQLSLQEQDGAVPPVNLAAVEGVGEEEDGASGAATTRLAGQLHDMDAALVEKERLLQELVRNQREFDTMRNSYERKMEDMQNSIKQIEAERNQVLTELSALDKRSSASGQNREDKEKWNQRLKTLEEELKKMRKKVKDHEKLLVFKEQGDHKIAALSQEVEKLKLSRAQLHKKIARDAKGHREKQQELEKQIVSLRKADMASRKVIRALETKLSASARVEHTQRRRQQIAVEKQRTEKEEREQERKWKEERVVPWMKRMVQRGVGQREAKATVEQAAQYKAQLEKELRACQAKRERLGGGGGRQGRELADEAEYLGAELEFRGMEEAKARRRLQLADKVPAELAERAAVMSAGEVEELLGALYRELVEGQDELNKRVGELHEAEVLLVEAKRSVDEARLQAEAKAAEQDSLVTQLQREYEAKLQFVFEQLGEASAVPAAPAPAILPPHLTPGDAPLRDLDDPRRQPSSSSSSRLSDRAKRIPPLAPEPSPPEPAPVSRPSPRSPLPGVEGGRGGSSGGRGESGGGARGRGAEVCAVQSLVMEKADRILASSRSHSAAADALLHPHKPATPHAQPRPLSTPKAGELPHANGQPPELSNVAQVLAPGGKVVVHSGAAKVDRRQRVEELRVKVSSLWEALQVPEGHRSKFRNSAASASSKPEQSLHALELEYAQQLKLVGACVEEARAQLEEGWREVGAAEAERGRLLQRLEELSQPDSELAALRLVRAEVAALEERVEATRQIRGLLHKREDMLQRLCDGAAQDLQAAPRPGDAARGGKAAAANQDALRRIVREYPKVVSTLQKLLQRWEHAEGRDFQHRNGRALEVLTHGDPDHLFRAMHHKLMSGRRSPPLGGASPEESSADKGSPEPPGREEEGQGPGERERKRSEEDTRRSASNGAGRGGGQGGGGANGSKKSTTSQMALRFEALKQTYAQVRSRSTTLGHMAGRQEAVKQALQAKGLLVSTPREGERSRSDSTDMLVDDDGEGRGSMEWEDGEEWGAPQRASSSGSGPGSMYVDNQRFSRQDVPRSNNGS